MIETQNIEFKESWRDEYIKYVSGFANAQGGSLFIGINDKGNVVGIEGADKLLGELPNKINDTTGIVADVNLLSENGKQFIRIDIAPSFAPVTFKGKLYYRSGSTLQELDGMAAQNFLMNKSGVSWDAQIIEGTGINDIDIQSVNYFVSEGIAKGRLSKSTENDSIEKILGNLKLMSSDGRMTMAALLLFGKDPQSYCLNARFKIGRFGNNAAELITQDLVDGNLIQMADKVIEVLASKYLIRPIHYNGMQRIEPLEIPERGLREILYNSIIHKSYDGPDNQLKVYDDRIVLWNYGKLPDGTTISNMFKEHRSMPRNKLIANAFYFAGFVEAWGRGFEIVEDSFKKMHLAIPAFSEEFGGITVIIKREAFQAIREGGSIDDRTGLIVKASGSNDNVIEQLTERQQFILQLLRENVIENVIENVTERQNKSTKISASFIAGKLGVSTRTIMRDLTELRKLGLVSHIGPAKGGFWKILN